MKQLNTIQKMEKLNDVFAIDEQGPGGAHHLYQVCKHGTARIVEEDDTFRTRPENMLATIQLQCGARKDPEALMWLNRRVEDRATRGVLGTETK